MRSPFVESYEYGNEPLMTQRDTKRPAFNFSSQLVNLLGIVVGIIAAYFMTIQSLKVDLATKAETVMVEAVDRKLAGFEVMLRNGVVTPEQFDRFTRDLEARLTRIENHLIENGRTNLGR